MKAVDVGSGSSRLPIAHDLTLAYALSLFAAVVMAAASVIGLLYPTVVYPTEELLASFFPNDLVNLAIGLPILLGSMWLARRGALVGLLCWPGALFYVVYTYIAYLFGVPFNVLFLPYLVLVALSVYTVIGLVASIDGEAVRHRLAGVVPARTAGFILAGLAALFTLRAVGTIAIALTGQAPVAPAELPVLVADSATAPAMFTGGVMLWRRQTLGYVAGLGLLFQLSMAFIALILYLILQPLITTAPFSLADTVVVSMMGLVCFVPTALFLRGATSSGN